MSCTKKWSIYVVALAVLVLGLNTGWADDDGPRNGQAVKQAIEEMFPGGRVLEVERETRVFRIYEVEVRVDGKVKDVTVLEDGTVLNVEEEVKTADLPAAVAAKIKQLPTGKNMEVEKVEHLSELKVVKVDPARIEYEVEYRANGKEQHVRYDEDGSEIHGSSKFSDDDDEGDDDDDDDEHEDDDD